MIDHDQSTAYFANFAGDVAVTLVQKNCSEPHVCFVSLGFWDLIDYKQHLTFVSIELLLFLGNRPP